MIWSEPDLGEGNLETCVGVARVAGGHAPQICSVSSHFVFWQATS